MLNKKLQKIHEDACMEISKALAKLTDTQAVVEIINPKIERVTDITLPIGCDEMVAAVCLPITGKVKGAALLVFAQKTAVDLSDLLIKKELGTTKELDELDQSALEELGNIVCGNYLTMLSNVTGVKIIEHVPQFSFDIFGQILEQTRTEFAQKTEKALTIEIEFAFVRLVLRGYFVLIFDTKEFQVILDVLQ
ncbi:MAG: chemotaxis protein CheC [Planctomycetota bacterium]